MVFTGLYRFLSVSPGLYRFLPVFNGPMIFNVFFTFVERGGVVFDCSTVMWRQAGISLPVRQQLLRLAECGWLHNKVRRYADARSSERAFGLVGQVGRAHARTRMHTHAHVGRQKQTCTPCTHAGRRRQANAHMHTPHARTACIHQHACMRSSIGSHTSTYRHTDVCMHVRTQSHILMHTCMHQHGHMYVFVLQIFPLASVESMSDLQNSYQTCWLLLYQSMYQTNDLFLPSPPIIYHSFLKVLGIYQIL